MLSEKELLYIEETAQNLSDYTRQHRRKLHQIPETALTEFKTSKYLEEELTVLGYRLVTGQEVANSGTGLIAEIGPDCHPVVGLRFDIDGLPVSETEQESHFPNTQGFHSKHPEKMHACGHDGHMAIGLTVARILAENSSRLQGKIRILFQPAEEGCRGARRLVDNGWLDSVDYFIAGHIVGREYGQTKDGPADCVTGVSGSLATTKMNAYFTGRSCHGACPENGASAITALCSAVLTLNAIPRNSKGATMINIGTISGGEGRNIVAAHASMTLEVRGETTELNQYMEDRALSIIQSSAALYNCQAETIIEGKAPSLVSSIDFHHSVNQLVRQFRNIRIAPEPERFRASEDAALMMEAVKSHGGKALFMLFPTDTTAPLHRNDYDFDEGILSKAVAVISGVALDLLV